MDQAMAELVPLRPSPAIAGHRRRLATPAGGVLAATHSQVQIPLCLLSASTRSGRGPPRTSRASQGALGFGQGAPRDAGVTLPQVDMQMRSTLWSWVQPTNLARTDGVGCKPWAQPGRGPAALPQAVGLRPAASLRSLVGRGDQRSARRVCLRSVRLGRSRLTVSLLGKAASAAARAYSSSLKRWWSSSSSTESSRSRPWPPP